MTIILVANLSAQNDKYPSKEEDRYNKEFLYKYVTFKPLDTVFILDFKSEYFKINDTELHYEHYTPEKYSTPHYYHFMQYTDSLLSIMPRDKAYRKASQEFERDIGRIGSIDKKVILKYEKRDSIEAFVFESFKYENFYFGEPGIWIGYSENNGKDWSYYYTGIVQKQPVFIKHYSQRPLIKEKGVLEIDICLLRQLSLFSHPYSYPNYECVKDGIYVTLDINIIAKDSDEDGLSDIIEDKFHTDKYNKDTNGNGISDNQDSNPRMNYPCSEKSKIFEAIINNEIDWNDKKGWGKLQFKDDTVFVTDDTETILIITDNEDLLGIRPSKYRIVFLMPEEYQRKENAYKTALNEMRISPLFKVDNKKNTYKLCQCMDTSGCTYLVRKTKKVWKIKIISVWIS